MKFTDVFVRRPVLAVVTSLMILVIGLISGQLLPTQQFPQMENTVISVSTTFPGADPSLVAGFITSPLENAIAQANGIDYITSSSSSSTSTISARLRMNFDANKALGEITTKVNSVLNQLPVGTQPPLISLQGGAGPSMYIAFFSDVLSQNQISDYLARIVQPRLQAVPGVQSAALLGGRSFALRVWLDPAKLEAYGLMPQDVSQALRANNYVAGLGSAKSSAVHVVLSAATTLHDANEFEALVVKQTNEGVVRLKDVAKVVLGSDNYDTRETYNGRDAVFIGIEAAPTANMLTVSRDVRRSFMDLRPRFPPSLKGEISFDASRFVENSISEVKGTLLESAIIVTLVMVAFLGSFRSAIIPTVTIPLSLIGTFAMMLLFGFSLNVLTLLAMVLAIGLVVDDAIIIVENASRHLSEGVGLVEAAIRTGRELGGPIVAMTVVLAAVYVPMGFQGGLTGALFTEFAFTLVGAVTVSAIVALTLSPMMCSRMLNDVPNSPGSASNRLAIIADKLFDAFQPRYLRLLKKSLGVLPLTVMFIVLVCCAIFYFYGYAKRELAPIEDQGIILNFASFSPNLTMEQKEPYQQEIYRRLAKFPETHGVYQINWPGLAQTGMVLNQWNERSRTSQELEPDLHRELSQISGAQIASVQLPPLPGSEGLPIQFVLGTSQPFSELNDVAERFVQEALKSGMFAFLADDLNISMPESTVVLDRDKIAALGLTVSEVAGALSTMLSGGYVGYFELSGRPYKVIPQVQQDHRLNSRQLLDYRIQLSSGASIPLSAVAKIEDRVTPQSLRRFQQLNATTVQGALLPGVAQGDALEYLKNLADRQLPSGYSVDYAGASRQYMHESSGFLTMFAVASVVIFLALAALFESFRDPIIILVSVPMSIVGALAFVSLGIGGASLNIYTEIGLVTLMGLISKHGILILQFANDLQRQGLSKCEAVEHAAAVRFRPILMTSAAMVLGVTPLILATGAGAVARFNMGLVIASGITIGTLFTLFVVPAVYLLIASDHRTRPSEKGARSAVAIQSDAFDRRCYNSGPDQLSGVP